MNVRIVDRPNHEYQNLILNNFIISLHDWRKGKEPQYLNLPNRVKSERDKEKN